MSFTRNFVKKPLFPGDFECRIPQKLRKRHSQGIIFAIISCQRVCILGAIISLLDVSDIFFVLHGGGGGSLRRWGGGAVLIENPRRGGGGRLP